MKPAFLPLILALGLVPAASAVEYLTNEKATPSSVEESKGPMESSFDREARATGLLTGVKKSLSETAPFIRDTQVGLSLRSYELYRDNGDKKYNQAWTIGGGASYKSGWLLDRFAVGSVLYTSQPLHAPGHEDGTTLLKPHQQGYTVVGQLYGLVKLTEDILVKLYKAEYSTPYINKDDGRMTPNTFEGYTVEGNTKGTTALRFGGGYIDKIKQRNSDSFAWMSEAAGATAHRGVYLGGIAATHKGLFLGIIDYHSPDIIDIFYSEAKYTWSLAPDRNYSAAAQFTHQQSTGEKLLTGKSFSTNQAGVRLEGDLGRGILGFGYTRNADGDNLQYPWGGYPGYTSSQVDDFNNAGEQAWLGKFSYDFTHLGAEGLKAYVQFVHSWGRVRLGKTKVPDGENEFDADLQWRPRWERLKNIWLRLRYATAANYGVNTQTTNEIRFIANYKFSIL